MKVDLEVVDDPPQLKAVLPLAKAPRSVVYRSRKDCKEWHTVHIFLYSVKGCLHHSSQNALTVPTRKCAHEASGVQ